MARVLSGVQPSGDFHLGNYLGAIRSWVSLQHEHDAFYCLVDLHALTLDIDPEVLRARTLEAAVNLLAAGLDPETCTLFVQSHVAEHPRLSWLLECIATMGELRRMTQFKEKSGGGGDDAPGGGGNATAGGDNATGGGGEEVGWDGAAGGGGGGQQAVRAGLFTYPVLMAADILLYDTALVPVGDDQRQHLELARVLANRFNNRFGPVFTVPDGVVPAVAARVMDLQHPRRKMSKSVDSPLGTVGVLDAPAEVLRKVSKAVTDADGVVRYDPSEKPGLSNLLELLAACEGRRPEEVAPRYDRYGDLKRDLGESLVELLRPVRQRQQELSQDPAAVQAVLQRGAERAREVASSTYGRAAEAMGLLPPAG